jgi:penicillin-binding protein 2
MPSFIRKKNRYRDIDPDEIFLDSSNLPGYNETQFEGQVERPVSRIAIYAVGIFFALITVFFGSRTMQLQIFEGQAYADVSRDNMLDHSIIFATRGLIYDRTGRQLAWNELPLATSTVTESSSTPAMFAERIYSSLPGVSHILGWVRYPKKDKSGAWWRQEYTGMSGVELSLDTFLGGKNGSMIVETDARGRIQRQNIVLPPENGLDTKLSIDAEMQSKLYTVLSEHANAQGFVGGAAVIMDVHTGEIYALTSFPEYKNQAFNDGDSDYITAASGDSKTPLINRAIAGLYAPGSIVKPIFAAAALNEKIISPDKTINSTGAITIPNPYDPEKPTIFRDWAVHGLVDMRTAIAVSSDEYFYTIGGGFGGQKGLGIERIDKYAQLFGLATLTGIALEGEQAGIIPTPEWKVKVFGEDDPWRIGNTYHTAIGQYGFQMTPIQAVRFTAAVANGGKLLVPQIIASSTSPSIQIPISDTNFQIVREGMRMAVTSSRSDATVKSLHFSEIHIAGKSGTAQIGANNEWMNSWSVGFWPAENPRFAYAVVLERAKAGTLSGASPGLVPFFQWLVLHRPEYLD